MQKSLFLLLLTCLFPGHAFAIPCQSAPVGLVLAMGMNAGTGTTVADSSGQGNNGTVSNTTWTTSGKYGSALVFNGTNAWVTVNDANSLDLTTAVTVEAWIFPTTSTGGWRTIVSKERTGAVNGAYVLYSFSNPGPPQVYLSIGGTDRILSGPTQLSINTWTHVAMTYDGTTIRLYLNGTQVASAAQTGTIATSTNPLRIGGNSTWGEYFQGTIDEVRVYNRALSGAEIVTDRDTPLQ